MTNRSQYESDIKTAEATKTATNETNAMNAQATINSATCDTGTSSMLGGSLSTDATIRKANADYIAAKQKAEATKQVTITNSRSTNLQANGDTGPA